jgi:hypothetical protein
MWCVRGMCVVGLCVLRVLECMYWGALGVGCTWCGVRVCVYRHRTEAPKHRHTLTSLKLFWKRLGRLMSQEWCHRSM